jgi:multiple sugar transport system substrate-binding protein
MQGGTAFAGALDAMQNATVADMKKLGFTLN